MEDTYRFNPWRRPGSAPTNDACGMAGGTIFSHAGPGVAVYANNSFARFGQLGSKVLPPAPSGAVWTAGSGVEVSWGIRFNHGGGYQYRLCPASEPLTEDCFARTPLEVSTQRGSNPRTRLLALYCLLPAVAAPCGRCSLLAPCGRCLPHCSAPCGRCSPRSPALTGP